MSDLHLNKADIFASVSSRPDVRHYFVIGGDGLSGDVDVKIEAENTAHKDILLLPMQDSFKG